METSSFPMLEGVITNLRALGPGKWEEIAAETQVPISTIRKIAYRETKNPGVQAIEKLSAHLLMRGGH